ncbi:hypothetical protein GQ55_9G221200 [Panicum hallii var. hallii]|uniref:Uncharacterized protein n=1 Tax=Panicum hallii var. hallii TaxID=1504633 RepID=A0A2T7C604_9POAL|nr:hypothetical protein GQ55_9G221200 [Panicum hallii var. hallii]
MYLIGFWVSRQTRCSRILANPLAKDLIHFPCLPLSACRAARRLRLLSRKRHPPSPPFAGDLVWAQVVCPSRQRRSLSPLLLAPPFASDLVRVQVVCAPRVWSRGQTARSGPPPRRAAAPRRRWLRRVAESARRILKSMPTSIRPLPRPDGLKTRLLVALLQQDLPPPPVPSEHVPLPIHCLKEEGPSV